jgi:hypothetical protein
MNTYGNLIASIEKLRKRLCELHEEEPSLLFDDGAVRLGHGECVRIGENDEDFAGHGGGLQGMNVWFRYGG